MNKKGLTISIIFEAESANYGDSIRNSSMLKKIVRKNNKNYTYISRQALRYSLVKSLGWDNTPVEGKGGGAQKVVQLSNAISLEEYKGDTDYLTNMGLSKRVEDVNNSIVKSEIHRSFYSYTISIDLDLIGIDDNGNIKITNEEKSKRINNFLEGVEYLYRDIRGRRENLAPVFIIGGIYDRKNPYFEHRLSLNKEDLSLSSIKDILNDDDVNKNTSVGILKGIFANETSIINELNAKTIKEFFNELESKVNEYYKGN